MRGVSTWEPKNLWETEICYVSPKIKELLEILSRTHVLGEELLLRIFESFTPNGDSHFTFSTRIFEHVMMRKSRAHRRTGTDILDFDIVQITVREEHRRKGWATKLFISMIKVAERMDRGVYLESCVTPESRSLGHSLVREGLATRPKYDCDICPNFLSVFPTPFFSSTQPIFRK
jgi:hypothetical protein